MELAVYEGERTKIRSLIKAGKLDEILCKEIDGKEVGFVEFLRRVLSLKMTEENAEKIAMVGWLFDEHCGGMTIEQVKKAVLAYSMGKLPIEPRSNYFDNILFARIIQEYKKTLPPKKLKPLQLNISKKEMDSNSELNAKICWNDWKETGRINPGNHHYFEELKKAGLIKMPKYTKEQALSMAKRRHEEEKSLSPLQRIRHQETPSLEYLRTVYQRIILEEHFKEWQENGETLISKISERINR